MPPRSDSSDLIVHARQSVFVMLLVSAVVLGSAFLDPSERLRRAYDEIQIVDALMSLWKQQTSHTNTRSLATIVGGPVQPDSDLYESYDVRALPMYPSQAGALPQLRCTAMLDLNQYFIVPEGRDRSSSTASKANRKQRSPTDSQGIGVHFFRTRAISHVLSPSSKRPGMSSSTA